MRGQSFYQKFKPMIVSFIVVFILFIFSNYRTGFVVYRNEKIVTNPGAEEELLRFLNSSKYKIDISIYVLTNPKIITQLNNLSKKGIEIRIILDDDIKSNYITAKRLSKNIKIRFGNESNITNFHAKYAIVDDECAWIGSMNWNVWGLNSNREIALITCNRNTVSKLSEIFSYDWKNSVKYYEH